MDDAATIINNLNREYCVRGLRGLINSERFCQTVIFFIDKYLSEQNDEVGCLDTLSDCKNFKSLRKNLEHNLNPSVLKSLATDTLWTTRMVENVLVEVSEDRRRSTEMHEMQREDLTCSICRDLLDFPVKTRCNHLFCRQCIHTHLDGEGGVCPMCRADLLLTDVLNVDLETMEKTKTFMVDCPNRGCKKNFLESKMDEHMKLDCIFRTVECINPLCDTSLLWKDRLQHFAICDKTPCSSYTYGCDFVGVPSEIDIHCDECMFTKIRKGVMYDIGTMFSQIVEQIKDTTSSRQLSENPVVNLAMRAFLDQNV
jgi:hypothetical protein